MRTFKDIYDSKEELEEGLPQKKSPMQRRREMSRRMKILAKKSSVKMAKKRARFKRRSTEKLQKSAARQAKMMVIKRSLGPSVKYGELPLQKRIQIDQKITAKKAKVIQKITKKLLRTLKQKEGERVKMAKQSAQDTAVGD